MAGFPMAKARNFVALHRRIGKAKAKLEALKLCKDKLEAELLKAFEKSGAQNLTVDNAVIFLRRQIWANTAAGKNKELAEAMAELGMDDLVKPTVHSGRLSSYVRELPRNDDDMPVLPDSLVNLVTVRDTFSVCVNEKQKQEKTHGKEEKESARRA